MVNFEDNLIFENHRLRADAACAQYEIDALRAALDVVASALRIGRPGGIYAITDWGYVTLTHDKRMAVARLINEALDAVAPAADN